MALVPEVHVLVRNMEKGEYSHMRGFNSASADLDLQIYSVFREFQLLLDSDEKKSPQNASLCKPDPLNGTLEEIRFTSQKYLDIHGYLIILHYINDPVLKVYLQLDLQQFLLKNDEFYWTSVLVESKGLYLSWLMESETVSSNAFFGNICCKNHLLSCWNSIVLRFEKRILPKRLIRRRGYKDKGTLASPSDRIRRQEAQRDEFLREFQLELEDRLKSRMEDTHLLRSYLQGVGILSDEQLLKFRIKRKELPDDEERTI